jgi:hypothetical protein
MLPLISTIRPFSFLMRFGHTVRDYQIGRKDIIQLPCRLCVPSTDDFCSISQLKHTTMTKRITFSCEKQALVKNTFPSVSTSLNRCFLSCCCLLDLLAASFDNALSNRPEAYANPHDSRLLVRKLPLISSNMT